MKNEEVNPDTLATIAAMIVCAPIGSAGSARLRQAMELGEQDGANVNPPTAAVVIASEIMGETKCFIDSGSAAKFIETHAECETTGLGDYEKPSALKDVLDAIGGAGGKVVGVSAVPFDHKEADFCGCVECVQRRADEAEKSEFEAEPDDNLDGGE